MFRKFFMFAFAIIFTCGLSCMKSVEATTAASFSDRGAYCTAILDDILMRQRGRKYASVKLFVKNAQNIQFGATVDITMLDQHGNHIWSGTKNAGLWGVKLQLGNDHSVYKIYVRVHEYPGGNADPRNIDNGGRCKTWEIAYADKCRIY